MASLSARPEPQRPSAAAPRFERRSPVSLPALVHTTAGSQNVRVYNLSPGGAMIEPSAPIAVGTAVRLSCGTLDVEGTLAWQRSGRSGISFDTPVDEAEIVRQLSRSDGAHGSESHGGR